MNIGKVRSLCYERVETDLCAACHAFILHVRAWGKLERLCALVEKNCSLFLTYGAILNKNCFVKRATQLQFREQK